MNSPTSIRLLVVDDEHTIADTLGIILRKAGYEVMVAYNGRDAITTARQFRPDIVVADFWMPPGINGIETCVQINQILPVCRIIMLSGHALESEFSAHRKKGFDFLLLTKPMHPLDLIKLVGAETPLPNGEEHPKVLNVDDSEEHRYSVSRLLAHAGFEVIEAATGAEALHRAIESMPDLVLLDIRLPDQDGFEVCSTLKRNPGTSKIKVIHVTAADRSSDAALRSSKVGADEYVAYPVMSNHLVKRIRELLQIRYLEQEPSPPSNSTPGFGRT